MRIILLFLSVGILNADALSKLKEIYVSDGPFVAGEKLTKFKPGKPHPIPRLGPRYLQPHQHASRWRCGMCRQWARQQRPDGTRAQNHRQPAKFVRNGLNLLWAGPNGRLRFLRLEFGELELGG